MGSAPVGQEKPYHHVSFWQLVEFLIHAEGIKGNLSVVIEGLYMYIQADCHVLGGRGTITIVWNISPSEITNHVTCLFKL